MIQRITYNNINDVIDVIYNTTVEFNTSNEIKNTINSKKMFSEFFKESFNDMEMFGYFINNKLVGVIGIEDDNYIPILYILKEYQKLNIGSDLVEYVVKYLENKTNFIDVCAISNTVDFYKKNGFAVNGEIKDNKVMLKYSYEKYKNSGVKNGK